MMGAKRKRWSDYQKRKVAAAQKWTCRDCKGLLGAAFHADHIVPLREYVRVHGSHRGCNAVDNMAILHPECHQRKSNEENLRHHNRQREAATGISRFFEECSSEYLSPIAVSPQVKLFLHAHQRRLRCGE
jgi:5-methylcytosine-specific restriction endonuclease McrA